VKDVNTSILHRGKEHILESEETAMKLMCKCGNIEDLRTDNKPEKYEIKNCNDGTMVLVCKKCSEVVFIEFNNR
jgi:hypothetical protein